MTELNEKTAREILETHKEHTCDYEDGLCGFGKCRVAFGYLQALEQVKPLVEALNEIRVGKKHEDLDNYLIMAARLTGIAQRAIAAYKGETKETK